MRLSEYQRYVITFMFTPVFTAYIKNENHTMQNSHALIT